MIPIGKLVRTKSHGACAPKGTWGIVIDKRMTAGDEELYTVHHPHGHEPVGHFYRNQLQVVEVCSA